MTVPIVFRVADGEAGLARAVDALCATVARAVAEGATLVVLSDRTVDAEHAPIPSLLATAAVHHHLIREGTRTQCGLIVETGEAREPHHFCLLIGYGAGAVNPYVALETLADMVRQDMLPGLSGDEGLAKAEANYIKAANKSIIKVASKMGISTVQSYRGAQIFEAVGIAKPVIDRYFTGTASRIQGVGLDVIAREALMRHHRGFPPVDVEGDVLDGGGNYQWRRDGEFHMWNPDTVAKLQQAVRITGYPTWREYAKLANDESEHHCTIRGLLRFKHARPPVPIEDVEPAKEIVKRFVTGAMSFGSISAEAHETLAIAMNRIGGKSNSGEGGEDSKRFKADPTTPQMVELGMPPVLRRSAIKQVASARFGVTAEYLVNADQLQIKMAQGAKPGEGGQLPGDKVDETIGRIRHSTPGVGLISPPPHHDIYSIEDLAQLIHDLKSVNPAADVSVKLVSEVGVGTIAAGVAKAKADHILIAGDGGGTGASPLTSIKHCGLPWELGLAETQQTLVLNGLRGRVYLQVDGQMKTGRDVAIGALLGAEEFGFSTGPLIASGCIMMRVCHLNTCPVGIATQDPDLRKKFTGQPEHVVNFMFFVAEELREIMAELGFAKLEDMVGRTELLDFADLSDHWKAKSVDLYPVLHRPGTPMGDGSVRHATSQDHGLANSLDNTDLIPLARPALDRGEPVDCQLKIKNTDRTVGGTLSGLIAKAYGGAGLPDGTVTFRFTGQAGQSFGAFATHGMRLLLEGDANDYVGKGLCGGQIAVLPAQGEHVRPGDQHHRRQHDPVRGDRGRGVPERRGRRAVRRPQQRRLGRRRGRRRPRVRVHDRRDRRRHRPDRPELRRRHERRRRLRVRRLGPVPQAVQPRHGLPDRPPGRGRPRRLAATAGVALQVHRLGQGQGRPGRLGQRAAVVRQGVPQRLPPRGPAARPGQGHGDGGRGVRGCRPTLRRRSPGRIAMRRPNTWPRQVLCTAYGDTCWRTTQQGWRPSASCGRTAPCSTRSSMPGTTSESCSAWPSSTVSCRRAASERLVPR